jgi:phage tail-like protein
VPPNLSNAVLTTYLFVVKIPDIDTIGFFSNCSGLELGFDVYEYHEGGNNDFVHRLPGGLHYPNLLLSRGLTHEQALLQWFYATQTQPQRKEMTLTLKGGDVERIWTFADAFPVRWTGPQLSSNETTVATETLEIAHAGMKLA